MPVLERVREAVTANWHIKLTALVLATVLWAVVAAEEPTTQTMHVSVALQLPEGRSLHEPVPPVEAVFAGPARELFKLYATPAVIRKTIPDSLIDSTYTLALSPTDVELPKHVEARTQDVRPRSVVVHLENVSRRTLPVVPRVTLRPDSGFAVFGGIAVAPGSVLVVGPGPRLGRLDHVSTETLELTEVQGPVRRTVALDTTGFGPLRLTRRDVEVSADVGTVSERVLMGVPVVVRSERSVPWTSDPLAVIVTVRGPTLRLVRLTRDSIAVSAYPTGTGRAETVHLQVAAPAGIEAVATPDTATVQRRGRA